ncbi:MAG: helix-turn-helix transcriptional regulator [Clostridia bacterium]|nr:helix-turn-helix transcriptional regulator [Clostridia bacterium]
MFYESFHSINANPSIIIESKLQGFPTHLHGNLEFITITEGEVTVNVDKKQYSVTPGTSVLVFPNQPHSFHIERGNEVFICIFSPHLVKAYFPLHNGKRPESNIFECPPSLIECLNELKNTQNILKIKSILYYLCSEFDKTRTYYDIHSDNNTVLSKIFSFVEDNYRKDCSLEHLSRHISYNKIYISKYFKKITGVSYTEYVNRYRINEATFLLKSSTHKILEIALECGFTSLRSFNRNFKDVIGMTPLEYRKMN